MPEPFFPSQQTPPRSHSCPNPQCACEAYLLVDNDSELPKLNSFGFPLYECPCCGIRFTPGEEDIALEALNKTHGEKP